MRLSRPNLSAALVLVAVMALTACTTTLNPYQYAEDIIDQATATVGHYAIDEQAAADLAEILAGVDTEATDAAVLAIERANEAAAPIMEALQQTLVTIQLAAEGGAGADPALMAKLEAQTAEAKEKGSALTAEIAAGSKLAH